VLVVAAALGGGLALGGAAALGRLGETKVVEAAPASDLEPVAFQRTHALSINQVYRAAAPGVVHITATSQTSDVFGDTQQQKSFG
jgi:hypothetical protein